MTIIKNQASDSNTGSKSSVSDCDAPNLPHLPFEIIEQIVKSSDISQYFTYTHVSISLQILAYKHLHARFLRSLYDYNLVNADTCGIALHLLNNQQPDKYSYESREGIKRYVNETPNWNSFIGTRTKSSLDDNGNSGYERIYAPNFSLDDFFRESRTFVGELYRVKYMWDRAGGSMELEGFERSGDCDVDFLRVWGRYARRRNSKVPFYGGFRDDLVPKSPLGLY